ncbi:MAG: hypothetical protein RLZZ283_16 [Candidatus Parcubacteria bacterium]
MIISFILILSAISLFGSYYAAKYNRSDLLMAIYVACIIITNVLVFKIAAYDLGVVTLYATAPTLIYAVNFLIADIVNERFGRKEVLKMIGVAAFIQVCVAVFTWIAVALPAAPFWTEQMVYEQMFGSTLRIAIAQVLTFVVVESLDAYVFHYFREMTQGKHLWMRGLFSTIPAMLLDTVIFFTAAFYGVMPIAPVITAVVILKWIVGVIDTPFLYLNRWVMSGVFVK